MVPLDFSTYGPLIVGTLLGFFALAAILLVPVYLFLKREERASALWTPEQLRRQAEEADAGRHSGDRTRKENQALSQKSEN